MPIWSSDYLNRVILEAEIEIAKVIPSVVRRMSIPVRLGISNYLLPEYVQDVRKILWKGMRLDPEGHSELSSYTYTFEDITPGPFDEVPFEDDTFAVEDITASTPSGKPTSYFYSGFGENYVRLSPSPNEALPEITGDMYGADIATGIIIEYYAVPDGVTKTIPAYYRRRTIKAYVLWKAFAKEGDGQNLQASAYFQARYTILLDRARRINEHLYSSILYTKSDVGSDPRSRRVARPVLPPSYGINVEQETFEEFG